jgi:hypothetical protein
MTLVLDGLEQFQSINECFTLYPLLYERQVKVASHIDRLGRGGIKYWPSSVKYDDTRVYRNREYSHEKIQTKEAETVKYKRKKLFVHLKERVWSFIRVTLYHFLKTSCNKFAYYDLKKRERSSVLITKTF